MIGSLYKGVAPVDKCIWSWPTEWVNVHYWGVRYPFSFGLKKYEHCISDLSYLYDEVKRLRSVLNSLTQ